MDNFLASTLKQQAPPITSGTVGEINWHWLDHGVMVIEPNEGEVSQREHVLLSAGVHGNETAPIELLDQLVDDLLNGRLKLNVKLMLMLGNPEAMRNGERYNDIDLNRLFSQHYQNYPSCAETLRASQLEALTTQFFEPAKGRKLHFDLHTAIRESHHVRFALLPYKESAQYSRQVCDWLSCSGVEAIVLNQAPSATFSYYSSEYCGADSCTLELGKAKPFGQNDLSQFAGINNGLRLLVNQGLPQSSPTNVKLKVYQVSQQLTKLSENFAMNFSDDVKNFTAFEQGEVLAVDGETTYRVQQPTEWVLFPNPKVRPGLRAGLMLVRMNLDELL
ncbi:succinylglutamate desuccinylase [Vibrio sp. CK2-1]|uniref:succinylglutamate desuccinylase n=1 Tax=Vibrio sp. CK2-1 TaxID=2912249 RepID=UPI001F01F06D|nr:succinylglutamate desuccinylase [Vibrio sp. CK2-1]MCF7353114.1 succinylglutamate desuccinylase [Vibrio sp. CK2-1]